MERPVALLVTKHVEGICGTRDNGQVALHELEAKYLMINDDPSHSWL